MGLIEFLKMVSKFLIGLCVMAPQFWGIFGKYAFWPCSARPGEQTFIDVDAVLIGSWSHYNILPIQRKSFNSVNNFLSYSVFKTECSKTFVFRPSSSIFPGAIFEAGQTKFYNLVQISGLMGSTKWLCCRIENVMSVTFQSRLFWLCIDLCWT